MWNIFLLARPLYLWSSSKQTKVMCTRIKNNKLTNWNKYIFRYISLWIMGKNTHGKNQKWWCRKYFWPMYVNFTRKNMFIKDMRYVEKTCDHLCFPHISHMSLKHFYGNKLWSRWDYMKTTFKTCHFPHKTYMSKKKYYRVKQHFECSLSYSRWSQTCCVK